MVERQEEADGAGLWERRKVEPLRSPMTQTPVLSPPLMCPQVGLGTGVLKYSPALRAGAGAGAGPGLPEGGACRRRAGPQLHLQERTIMLESCSTLGLRPT